MRLSTLDVGYFKDVLAGYVERGIWSPCRGVSRDYVSQVAAEKKVFKRRVTSSDGVTREVWRWEPRTAGSANHFWDCEVYAVAAAHMLGLDELPDWRAAERAEARAIEEEQIDDYLSDGAEWAAPSTYQRRGGSWI